jgi:hypothetical protein
MSTETMPDAGADINQMDLAEVRAELAAYRPSTAEAVVTVEEWLARRRALWRRLDQLVGPGGGITAERTRA